jgi:hypothetical protein
MHQPVEEKTAFNEKRKINLSNHILVFRGEKLKNRKSKIKNSPPQLSVHTTPKAPSMTIHNEFLVNKHRQSFTIFGNEPGIIPFSNRPSDYFCQPACQCSGSKT